MKNVFIIDDHRLFIEGLTRLLHETSKYKVVGSALSAEEFLAIGSRFKIDIVLLDINLPGISGIELSKKLKQLYPAMKIVIVSMVDSHNLIISLKKNKVDGFLPKNTELEEVMLCLDEVCADKCFFPENNTQKGMSVTLEGSFLTKREIEIIRHIIQGKSSAGIASELHISVHTVETHRKNINQKLGVRNVVELIKVVNELNLS